MSCSKHKKTSFNEEWLKDEELSAWVAPCERDRFSVFCKLCKKVVALSNMGKQALTSHMQGKKHLQTSRGKDMTYGINVFLASTSKTVATKAIPSDQNKEIDNEPGGLSTQTVAHSVSTTDGRGKEADSSQHSKIRGMDRFIVTENVARAEILWALQSILTHTSMSAAGKTSSLFTIMFPDSEIAKNMTAGRAKISYVIAYGLGPYFKKEIINDISENDCFGISFDESLNKVSQKQQMDFVIRYWSKTKEETESRYIGSAFLGHTTSADLLEEFKKQVTFLNLKKLIHISMDGPNVNLKFLRDLKSELKEEPDDPTILEIGSCGLHSLHNAFKTAVKVTDWGLVEFLRAIYNVFKNVPARRADYMKSTNSKRFPLKFCAVRWLQNVDVANRAQEILMNLEIYTKGVERDRKEPKSESFQVMKRKLKDKMLGPKLAFFKMLASEVDPFLRDFQAEKPLAPFLYTDMTNMIHSVMTRFVKKDKMEDGIISKIDLTDKETLIVAAKIDLGYETREAIRKVEGANERDILLFRQECLICLKTFCSKLLQTSPITYELTRALSFCDPAIIAKSINMASKRLCRALEIFVTNKWISGISADKIEREFKALCLNPVVSEKMKTFTRQSRLDHFWKEIVANSVESDLMGFLRKIFVLAHGNAAVERGFSVNKECLVENQSEDSLVSQRFVWEGIKSAGGVEKVKLCKSLIHATKNARAKYHEALAQKKKEEDEANKARKERKRSAALGKELQQKRRRLMEDAQKEAQRLDDEILSLAAK